MNKFVPAALLSTLATFAVIPYSARAETTPVQPVVAVASVASVAAVKQAPVKAAPGQILYDATGKSIGPVYALGRNGAVVLSLDDHLVTVPGSSLSLIKRKLTTSLSRDAVAARH